MPLAVQTPFGESAAALRPAPRFRARSVLATARRLQLLQDADEAVNDPIQRCIGNMPIRASKTSALNNETFNFAVANAVNGTFARSLATATFVIPASATYVPAISVGDVTIASTATQAVFTVSLSGPTTNTVSMIYGVGGGTAPSTAYSPIYGTLTFQPGQTTQTISVPVTASKSSALNNETFNFAVANAVNGTFARSLATATFVVPASAPYVPTISVGDVTIASTATQAVFM